MIIALQGEDFVLRPQTQEELRLVRKLPVRKFVSKDNCWRAPLVFENWDELAKSGHLDDVKVPRPARSAYNVQVIRNKLAVFVPLSAENIFILRNIPDNRMWDPKREVWLCKPSVPNFKYLEAKFPGITWDGAALALKEEAEDTSLHAEGLRERKREILEGIPNVIDYKFGTTPFDHQKRGFLLARDEKTFAFLMEQGTGKSKLFIDNVCYLFGKQEIDAVLLVCPNSVKSNWPEEIVLHSPENVQHEVVVWDSGVPRDYEARLQAAKKAGKIFWVIMNVEAFSTLKGADFALKFCAKNKVIACVDESTKIKTPSATRTKNILKLRPVTTHRRIMSGTPITQGPLDAYSQFAFLDPSILGFSSFFSFKNFFAVTGGYGGKEVVGYTNLETLQTLVDAYSYRVLKVDCLDLPEKIYQRLTVTMNPEQKRLYKQVSDEMLATFSGHEIEVINVLAQMLRLAQITGGYLPIPEEERVEPIPGANPKLEALLDTTENITGKAIIWCRFRPEIDLIQRALRDKYGDESVVEFHGGVNTDDRAIARRSFQDPDSPVRWFVGQVQTGGVGLTLTQAKTVFYFSNSFSLEDRLQSEDRAHRIGQDQHVTYIDIVARGTIDVKVLAALRSKKNLANLITGDSWTQWI